MLSLKQMISELVNNEAPDILRLENKLAHIMSVKSELYEKVRQQQLMCDEIKEKLNKKKCQVLEVLSDAKIKKVVTPSFVAERKRNTNPTVAVIDENIVPEKWIIREPRVDKRGIQSYFVRTGETPPGTEVEYKEYILLRRR